MEIANLHDGSELEIKLITTKYHRGFLLEKEAEKF